MVHRRKGRKVWEFKCPTRTGGWISVSSGSLDKGTARAMAQMCKALGRRGSRDWDILDAVQTRRVAIAQVYDAWQRQDLDGLRARIKDIDLVPYLDRWEEAAGGKAEDATIARYRLQVETLLDPAQPFPRSGLSPDAIDQWLTRVARTGSTRARYFAALRSFVRYLRSIGALDRDPLEGLTRPKSAAPRCLFLEFAQVQRVMQAAPAVDQPLYALCYGAGAELSAALATRRRDVLPPTREVHLHGTKGSRQGRSHRDRIVRVSEWAWPTIERAIGGLLPDAWLFENRDVNEASRRHRLLLASLELTGFRLHDSRHFWAVRMARAGAPAEMIARQLGHKDAMMVIRVYGRFFPSSDERERWEQIASQQDSAPKTA